MEIPKYYANHGVCHPALWLLLLAATPALLAGRYFGWVTLDAATCWYPLFAALGLVFIFRFLINAFHRAIRLAAADSMIDSVRISAIAQQAQQAPDELNPDTLAEALNS